MEYNYNNPAATPKGTLGLHSSVPPDPPWLLDVFRIEEK